MLILYCETPCSGYTSAIEAISFCIETNIDGNKIKEQTFIPSKKCSRLALSYRNAIALLPVISTKMHCDYWVSSNY